jgi:predicted amidophosphoribosyltransferase
MENVPLSLRALSWHQVPDGSDVRRRHSLVGQWVSQCKPYDYERFVANDVAFLGLSNLLVVFSHAFLGQQRAEIIASVPSSRIDSTNRIPGQLADNVSRFLSIVRAPSDTLRKVRSTKAAKLFMNSLEQEREQYKSVFADSTVFSGKSILLIDDILDSGGTVWECARALSAAGAREIQVITLTKTSASLIAPLRSKS